MDGGRGGYVTRRRGCEVLVSKDDGERLCRRGLHLVRNTSMVELNMAIARRATMHDPQ